MLELVYRVMLWEDSSFGVIAGKGEGSKGIKGKKTLNLVFCLE